MRPSAEPTVYTAELYDDDGVSTAYTAGGYSLSTVRCAWARSGAGLDSVTCSVRSEDGSASSSASASASVPRNAATPVAPPRGFAEAPPTRLYTYRFLAAWPPASVTLNGAPVPYAGASAPDAWGEGAAWPRGGGAAWAYHGDSASLWVRAGSAPWGASGSGSGSGGAGALTVTFPAGAGATDALLSSALPRKVARAQAAKGAMNRASWTVNPCDVPLLLGVAGSGSRVEEAVARAHSVGSAEAVAAMLAAVRGEFTGLAAGLRGALGEVQALLDRQNMNEEETRAVEDMKRLVQDALK